MRRVTCPPRADWRPIVEAQARIFHDDLDVRLLVRDERPAGARPPVVGIIGIGQGLQLQIAMQAHAPILTACR